MAKLHNLISKKNLLIIGIGNSIKGDDGVGPEIIKRLKDVTLRETKGLGGNINLLDVGSAPENYTKKIKDLQPDKIIIIDAVAMGEKAGTVKVIDEKEIASGYFTTHNMPLNMFVEYIKQETEAEIIFVGIQPKSTKFGEGLSEPVQKAIEKIVKELIKE
jgi:hydrogenase 3 maturation protease